jgi:hypothetical protein
MIKHEFKLAYELAFAKPRRKLPELDGELFDRFGLPDFKPVHCSLTQVAALLRWQCLYLNGEIDGKELDSIASIARTKFIIVSFGDARGAAEVASARLDPEFASSGGRL